MDRPDEALDPDEMARWDAAVRHVDEFRERATDDETDKDKLCAGETIEPEDFFR